MSSLPFELFVRHRGYRLPYPLHGWHPAEDRDDGFPPEDFKPSEFEPVNLILRRIRPECEISMAIEGTPLHVTLADSEDQTELAAWTPPRDDNSDSGEGLWGRAGLYRVRVQCGASSWVTTIEVQPHYLTFEHLGRMCADVERLSTWVAYDILPYAPIFRSRLPKIARADGSDEDPAVQYALLKEMVPETLRTLRFLSTSPQLAIKPTYVATRAGVSGRQDRRSLRMEERLNEREEGWSVQRSGELSFDIYENRFVKRLLQELQRRLGQLQARLMDALYELEHQEDEVRRRLRKQFGDQEERIRREEPLWTRPIRSRHGGLRSQIASCGRMRDSLRAVMHADLLRDVSPLQGIVRPTNVLQYDPQYSRLWSIYRLLRLSDRGETSKAYRFHRRSRPSWELYEMWTAVQVMETCMRDLRFTRVISQSVAEGNDDGLIFLYDTPRPAKIRLGHETEPLQIEVIYGGFIPMSERALMAHHATHPSGHGETPNATSSTISSELSSEPAESEPPNPLFEESDLEAIEATGAWSDEAPLVTRGVQTAPDLQVLFYDSETGELLGLIILDAKYKGGRRIWGREGGRPTDDRLVLESYLLDIHRRDREEAIVSLYSQPADEIVLGSYALFPGERFGRDLPSDERRSADGRLGAIKVSPDYMPSEELTQLLLEAMARAQVRRSRNLPDANASPNEPDDEPK